MLSLKTDLQSIYEDGSIITIHDTTDEQTEQVENPEGSGNYEEVPATSLFYGTDDNPERDELALYLLVIKKNLNNDRDKVVYNSNPEPLTADNWSVSIDNKDGWYRRIVIGVLIYTVSVDKDTVVYLNGSIYIALKDAAINPSANNSDWKVVTDLEDITDNPSVYVTEEDFGIIRNSEICAWNNIVESIKKDGCRPCKGDNSYNEIDLYLNTANIAFCSGLYPEGEKAVRLLDDFCKC